MFRARQILTLPLVTLAFLATAPAVWAQNLQELTPSTLLQPGQVEVKLFNNLYTQTAFFDGSSDRIELNERSTFFTGFIQTTVGVNDRISLGADALFRSTRTNGPDDSQFDVFGFGNGPDRRTALALLGPKVKFTPVGSIPNLAIQSTFLFPLGDNLEGRDANRPFLEHDDFQWWNQVFYDRRLSDLFLAYVEASAFFRLDSADENAADEWIFPLKAILNVLPTSKTTFYGILDYTPSTNSAYYFQTGIGAKYLPAPGLELEVLATTFPVGQNRGAGSTLNFGIRVVR